MADFPLLSAADVARLEAVVGGLAAAFRPLGAAARALPPFTLPPVRRE